MEEKPSPILNQKVLKKAREDVLMKKTVRTKRSTLKKIAVAGMALILAGGGIAYAAGNYWDLQILKDLGLAQNADTKNFLEENGYLNTVSDTAQPDKQVFKATDKDITVELAQVVADENSMTIYIKATFGENYDNYDLYEPWHNDRTGKTQYSADPFMDIDLTCANDGSNAMVNGGGGAVGNIMEIPEERSVLYEYHTQGYFHNRYLQLHINGFYFNDSVETMNTDNIYEGNWDLYFTPTINTQKCIYTIGKDITVNGETLTIEKLEVSPLSYSLAVSGDDAWRKLKKIAGVVKEDKQGNTKTDAQGNTIFYDFVDPTDEKLSKRLAKKRYYVQDILTPAQFYQKNTEIESDGGIVGAFPKEGDNPDYNYVYCDFHTPVNPNEYFTSLRFAGQLVDLTDCQKEVIK